MQNSNENISPGFRHVFEAAIVIGAIAGLWDISGYFTQLADLGTFLGNILRLASSAIIITIFVYFIYLLAIFLLFRISSPLLKWHGIGALRIFYTIALLPIGAILSRNFAVELSTHFASGIDEKTLFHALKYLWIYVPLSIGLGFWIAGFRTTIPIDRIYSRVSGTFIAGSFYLILSPYIIQNLILNRANVYSEVTSTTENFVLSAGILLIAIALLPIAIWVSHRLIQIGRRWIFATFWIAAILCPFIPPIFAAKATVGTPPSGNELHGKNANVIIVSMDTTRYDELSCFGSDVTMTPNLDRVAEKSSMFDNAVVPMPLTGPSHISMFTGLQPDAHNVKSNGVPLDGSIPTLATIADEAGYKTGAVISGYPLSRRASGMQRGFHFYDDSFKRNRVGEFIPDMVWKAAAAKILRRILRLHTPGTAVMELDASETTGRAIDWLDDNSDKPFLMFIHYFDPHYTYIPPDEFKTMYMPDYSGPYRDKIYEYGPVLREIPKFTPDDYAWFRAQYRGEISYADREFGRIVDWLDGRKLWDDTMVIVVADHGESFEHDYYFNHNNRLYEQLIHVPLMVHSPMHPELSGVRIDDLVNVSDIFNTVRNFLDLESPDQNSVQTDFSGHDVLNSWNHDLIGLAANPDSLTTWQMIPTQSYTLGESEGQNVGRFFSFRFPGWHLIYGPESEPVVPTFQYFDLKSDPNEMNDIFAEMNWDAMNWLEILREWAEGQMSGESVEISTENREQLDALGYI